MTGHGSLVGMHFARGPIRSVADLPPEPELRALLHLEMLEAGYSYVRRGYVVLSIPLDERDVDGFAAAVESFLVLLELPGEEAEPGERLDQLVLLVGEVREQRVGEEVDRLLERLEVVGVVDVPDERAVDGLDRVVDDEVLVGEPVDHRREAPGRCGRGAGRSRRPRAPWCCATTPQ